MTGYKRVRAHWSSEQKARFSGPAGVLFGLQMALARSRSSSLSASLSWTIQVETGLIWSRRLQSSSRT